MNGLKRYLRFDEAIAAYTVAVRITSKPLSSATDLPHFSRWGHTKMRGQTLKPLSNLNNKWKGSVSFGSLFIPPTFVYGCARRLRPLQGILMQTQIINFFFNKMINCITENRQYIIPTLEEETKVNPRLSHADYCSNLIGSAFVGSGGRGIFAKADITPGALLVAAKAICCVYEDRSKYRNNLCLSTSFVTRPRLLSRAPVSCN